MEIAIISICKVTSNNPLGNLMFFETMQQELSELFSLVRQSERYCVSVASRPELATENTHAMELQREQRIAELSARYGIKA